MIRDEVTVNAYDFRQAHSLSADQLRELNEHCVNLCRALQRYVPESTGLGAKFSVERVFSGSFDDYLDQLPEGPILAICEWLPNSPPLVWQLDFAPTFAYMDAMLGGDGTSPAPTERDITVLERALVGQMVEEFIATWTDVWPALEGTQPHVMEVRQSLGRFGTASLQEPMMAVFISCTMGQASGLMRIALPTVVLRLLLKQTSGTGPTISEEELLRRAPTSEIGNCRVAITIRLARTQITLRQLRELRVGDVIFLDRGPRDQLDVAVAGKTKFRGISGLVNGRLAVRVTGWAEE